MESTPEGAATLPPLTQEQKDSIEQSKNITMQNAANPLAPVNPFPEKKGIMQTLKEALSSLRGSKEPPKKPDLPEPSV